MKGVGLKLLQECRDAATMALNKHFGGTEAVNSMLDNMASTLGCTRDQAIMPLYVRVTSVALDIKNSGNPTAADQEDVQQAREYQPPNRR